MDLEHLTVVKARELLDKGKISSKELFNYYLEQIEKKNKDVNAYITLNEKAVEEIKNPNPGKLSGIPIAVKDVFTTENILTTCASHILEGYKPTFESTVTKRILEEGAIIIGKTNLDEFCHGSSTETSYYGTSKNPHDTNKSPGGSSGGSSAAVAADLCTAALGTETAGSIRLPASWTGTVGLKPTYGRVSRYGVLAMGSSLDSPGPIVRSVGDAAYLLGIIAGYDDKDFTSSKEPVPNYYESLNMERIKGLKLGLPKEWIEMELEDGVRRTFKENIDLLKDLGAEIKEISLLDPKYAMAVYTIVCRSEVSSNLSRYDGTRYGLSADKAKTTSEYVEKVRGKGFGNEPKRRVMTGTFSLSAGYADEYYDQAEMVRQKIIADILAALNKVDLIVGPAAPITATSIGEAATNPLFGEMMDILFESSSLGGLPGISIPSGKSDNGMPVGLQFIGKHFEEQLLLDAAYAFEHGKK